MLIDTNYMVSITEANQNFSRVARMADRAGAVVILKNNAPRYVLREFSKLEQKLPADRSTRCATKPYDQLHTHCGKFSPVLFPRKEYQSSSHNAPPRYKLPGGLLHHVSQHKGFLPSTIPHCNLPGIWYSHSHCCF